MKPSLKKLHSYFRLEAERGYDNNAVMGGLDRMLDHWMAEARLDGLPEELIQAVASRVRDYPRLAPSSRAEVLEGLWTRIQRSESVPSIRFVSPQQKSAPEESKPVEKPRKPPMPQSAQRPEMPAPELSQRRHSEMAVEEMVEAGISGHGVEKTEKGEADPLAGQEGVATEAGLASKSESEALHIISPASEPPAALDASIRVLPGIGPRIATTMSRLGLDTLRDLLFFFPRRYDDYSQLKPINRLKYGEEVTVIGTVQGVDVRQMRSGRSQLVEALISDGSGVLRLNWFNQVWVAKRLHRGMQITAAGKVDQYLGRLVINNPEVEPLEQQQLSTNRIVPVYSLTANITQRWLRRLMSQVTSYWAPRIADPLPAKLRLEAKLPDLPSALSQVHFPDSWDELAQARQRLAFDEIFLLQLGVLGQKRAWQDRTARKFLVEDDWLDGQISRLPYTLTGAQQHALTDLRSDLASGRPMNRLLQGDVGSGKTVVAALAIAMVTQHGSQAAMMAPTSILAEQHYRSLTSLLSAPDQDVLPIRLLVGATPESEKAEIRAGLADGQIKLVVGTHALIEDPVVFADLQLAIIDEQHRFGVQQRYLLRAKGGYAPADATHEQAVTDIDHTNEAGVEHPLHLLVMTATPIPRSLALTVYGDLDLTVMDEMPSGRQPVSTFVLMPRERERAYRLIQAQIAEGRQAFIIYPLIGGAGDNGALTRAAETGESEKNEVGAAVEGHARLQKDIFPSLKLGLLHGRMRPDEKDEVMARFRDGEYNILVSTTVVEVGVDVPNASVMLIEGANHFGLAQLHQLRGRVGRGADRSYCLLIPDEPGEVENARLQAMLQTNDGFLLAERDLEQRGPGQFLGTRQAGYSELQMANLTDVPLIEKARHHAQMLFEVDPDLAAPEHRQIKNALDRFWGEGKGDIS